ncbi:hypothetical protein [Aliikangiella sp. G2MR2-5]|uniref:hypothetical protein n=1 Tax=Aliikangiella sp. G2MR2-5 TaxID=2788943 RepID=UPI0018ABCC46|nr:hypothetical protein [Aliikangiella sp. G2MR2-5]
MTNKFQYWQERKNKIVSHTGGWKIGEGVFCHGFSMMDDLVGKKSYMQVLILNATGKLVSENLAKWFEAVFICLSWPDPRIWCNHIGALGGSYRNSIVASTCAGILAADSRTYGSRPILEGVDFIKRAVEFKTKSEDIESFVKLELKKTRGKPQFMGYARPITKGDERIIAMEPFTKSLGFDFGEHMEAAYEIEEILIRDFNEGMNINGYVSAFLADQGISPEEAYSIFTIVVNSGVLACYLDSSHQSQGAFLPIACGDIEYIGKPKRSIE